jgi:chromosomal replication initiation ATPase DnaA
MTPARQLRLDLRRKRHFQRSDFIVSESNADAIATIDSWPDWPGGRLALVGPEGCGKTHLAQAWANKVGAVTVSEWDDSLADLHGRPVLFEDADRRPADETLFHLINIADAGASLLVTGRAPPRGWPADLPDLRSRLNGITVAMIAAPDDVVLEGVLAKLFRELNIRPAEGVIPYLVRRIERSVRAAMNVVAGIDEYADAEGREVTRALAKRVVEGEGRTLDLFE